MPRKKHDLISWNQLHSWQQDNEYILTHYRQASQSFTSSLSSVFAIHNETINIWSHGVGAAIWAALLVQLYVSDKEHYMQATALDVGAVGIMLASVVACFTLSSIFHVCSNHSPGVWRLTSQLDHLGIVLVIWGSTIPTAYFGFYCFPDLQKRYCLLATAFASASAYATFQPAFRTPTGRKIRFLLYSALGLSAFIPAVQGVRMNGWEKQNDMMSLTYFLGLGLLNFTGAATYAARIPERWCPGRYDILGASHQIMHVLVMCGAVSQSLGLLKALTYWNELKSTGRACFS